MIVYDNFTLYKYHSHREIYQCGPNIYRNLLILHGSKLEFVDFQTMEFWQKLENSDIAYRLQDTKSLNKKDGQIETLNGLHHVHVCTNVMFLFSWFRHLPQYPRRN